MLEGMTHFKHEAVDRTGSLQIVHSTLLHQQPAQDAVVALKQLRKTTPPSGTFTTKVPSCGTTSLLCWVR